MAACFPACSGCRLGAPQVGASVTGQRSHLTVLPAALVSGVQNSRADQSWDRRCQDPARPQDPGHCRLGPPHPCVSLEDDEAPGRAGLPQCYCPLRGLCHRRLAGCRVQGSAHQCLVTLPVHVTRPPCQHTWAWGGGRLCSGLTQAHGHAWGLRVASRGASFSGCEKSPVCGALTFCTRLVSLFVKYGICTTVTLSFKG